MAAVGASRGNPSLAAFYRHLRANGNPDTVCLVAVMCKIVCLMDGLSQNLNFFTLRSNTPLLHDLYV
jgi:hypothetical protein